ncbi:MAG TPA: hypothetical protein VL354_13230, partial [Spirochaetia bacterium]|nr:hypothetical protein [Spirochaetia bacterium]
MGNTGKLTGLLVALVAVLSSCATIERSWDQSNAETVVRYMNDGQSQKLAAMSATPFLVDGEIVAMRADVASFWTGILRSGFRVQGPTLTQG